MLLGGQFLQRKVGENGYECNKRRGKNKKEYKAATHAKHPKKKEKKEAGAHLNVDGLGQVVDH